LSSRSRPAAASDAAGPAGALLPAVDGARQLAAADAAAATNARAFVAGQTPALLPLVLGTASEDDAPGPVVVAGFAERADALFARAAWARVRGAGRRP
jgi:hypothetical protein